MIFLIRNFYWLSLISLSLSMANAYENGKTVNLDGFPSVMVINKTPQGKPSFRCSGVIIDPHFILYAGHCIERKAPFTATLVISGEAKKKNITITKVFSPPLELIEKNKQENISENHEFLSQHPEVSVDRQMSVLESARVEAAQENSYANQEIDVALVQIKEKLPDLSIRLAEHRLKPNDPILVGGYGMKRAISEEVALISRDETLDLFEKITKALKKLNHSTESDEVCLTENHQALEILKRYDRAFDLSQRGHGTLTSDRRDAGLIFNQHFSLAPKKSQKATLPLDQIEKEIDRTQGIRKETYQVLHSVLNMPNLTKEEDEEANRLRLRKRPAAQTNTHRGDSGAPAFRLNGDLTLPKSPELVGINFGGLPMDYPYGMEFYVRVDLESAVGRWIQSTLNRYK